MRFVDGRRMALRFASVALCCVLGVKDCGSGGDGLFQTVFSESTLHHQWLPLP